MAEPIGQRGRAVVLGRVVGLPDGGVQAELMPGLEPSDAVAMCNTCVQAFAHRQMQLLNATNVKKSDLLVPSGAGGWRWLER